MCHGKTLTLLTVMYAVVSTSTEQNRNIPGCHFWLERLVTVFRRLKYQDCLLPKIYSWQRTPLTGKNAVQLMYRVVDLHPLRFTTTKTTVVWKRSVPYYYHGYFLFCAASVYTLSYSTQLPTIAHVDSIPPYCRHRNVYCRSSQRKGLFLIPTLSRV